MNCNLVVFDWAGTLIDFGCRAPLVAFLDAFERHGLPIDEVTARRPMGAHKRDHVREILADTDVAERARGAFGRSPDDALTELIYSTFTRRLLEVLPDHAEPIPGAANTIARLRERGVAIGSTTGYTRLMMSAVEPLARAAGIVTDALVCADEVPQGRPAPWACFRIAERLGRYPLAHALKVGDTPADVAEGRNAGMVTIGIGESGNEVGLDQAQLAALADEERRRRVEVADARLHEAGAHAVLRSVAELPAWLEENGR